MSAITSYFRKDVCRRIFFGVAVLFTQSCCTKMACEDATHLGNIDIFGFSEQEADTVVVTSFVADGTFSQPTDTIVTVSVPSADNTWRQLNDLQLDARQDHNIRRYPVRHQCPLHCM